MNYKAGKARRARSLAYAGVWGGNGEKRFKAKDATARKAAAVEIREGR